MIRNYEKIFSRGTGIKGCANYIKESRAKRVFELFGGKLGAVNGTKKDAANLIKSLDKHFNSKDDHIDFENKSCEKSFKIVGKFKYDGDTGSSKTYTNDAELIVYEDKSKKDNKICIQLEIEDEKVGIAKKGLTLDDKKIAKAIETVLKSADVDLDDCYTPDSYQRKRERDNDEYNRQSRLNNRKSKNYDDDSDSKRSGKNNYKPYDTSDKDTNYSQRAYVKDYMTDYSYSRLSKDPYSAAWA